MSSLSRRCGTSIDVPPRLLPLKRCVFALSSLSVRLHRSVHLAGDVALPHRCRWGAQCVLVVVERLRDVVVVGSSDAVEGGGGC